MKTKSITIAATLALIALVGCGSNSTNVVNSPTDIDAAPPAIPTDLTGSVQNSQVLLVWSPNAVDTDVVGYIVYREKGELVANLVSSPLVETWYLDTRPDTMGDNAYRVSAIDAAGNESEYSTVTVTINEELERNRDIRPVSP